MFFFFSKCQERTLTANLKQKNVLVNALKFGPNWLWLLRVNIDLLRLWITAAFSKRE